MSEFSNAHIDSNSRPRVVHRSLENVRPHGDTPATMVFYDTDTTEGTVRKVAPISRHEPYSPDPRETNPSIFD
jgi:hypothetical protein